MTGLIAGLWRRRRRLTSRPGARAALGAGMFCVVLAACTSDGSEAPSTSTTSLPPPASEDLPTLEDVAAPEWEPATRTEEIAVAISEGELTAEHAVDALALIADGMPGASSSRLPPGDGFDGSYARMLIEAFRDDLTPEQLAFVDDYYVPGELVGTVTSNGGIQLAGTESARDRQLVASVGLFPAGHPAAVSPETIDDLGYLELLAEVHQRWRDHLPDMPEFEIELYLSDKPGGMDALNDGLCRIRVLAGFTKQPASKDKVKWFFAHEIFHCIQDEWLGSKTPPPWVVEGSADFAAYDLFRKQKLDYEGGNPDWFINSYRPLNAREYSAWPLYENAHRSGIDVYGSIRAMISSPGQNTAATLVMGGLDGAVFRRDWSSRTLRSQSLSGVWWLPWPTHAPASGPVDNAYALPRGLGTYNVVGAGGFSSPQLAVIMEPDVGLVTARPIGGPLTTWTALGTKTVGDGSVGTFCFSPDQCRCPDGTTSSAIPMTGQIMIFSYPASDEAVKSEVRAEPWNPDTECREEWEPDEAQSNGDPHLLTFDGLPYDVITLGEFVTARDPAGDFEVQTRHQPFMFGAGTTAVALGTGANRITFTSSDFFAFDPVVRVDGEVTDEDNFEVGEVQVVIGDTEMTATWSDGSMVELRWFLGWFVHISVPPERSTRMEGLVGSADGDFGNDLRFPDGTVVDTVDAQADQSPFVLSWAVDEETTLFDYELGETIATFRIPHPHPDPPPIDDAVVAECTVALGNEAAAHEVSWCAYDVSATGETGFVEAYVSEVEKRTGADLVPQPPEPGTTTTLSPPVVGVSGEPTLILDADSPSGLLDVTEGTVMVAIADCPEAFINLSLRVTGDHSLGAFPHLCDPSGLDGISAGDNEWFNGEAYVWLPGTTSYEVALDFVLGDYDDLGEVAIYIDPSPTVINAADLADGDERTLEGVADTVVYLPEPNMTFDLIGINQACGDVIYWTDTFPRLKPHNLRICDHDTEFDLPPTDRVVPFVVFARTPGDIDLGLTPTG